MNKVKRKAEELIQRFFDKAMGNGLMQEENTATGERYITPGMPELLRQCGAEGIVLLKNDDNLLPFKETDVVSVFGRCQLDWFYVGYGSGGDVHPPYEVSLFEGLDGTGIKYNEELVEIYREWCKIPENAANHGWWGHWPYYHPEMPLTQEVVSKASEKSSAAMIILGRAAGEDRENVLKEGSYYLTAEEKRMLSLVCKNFTKVVVIMDCGNVIDLSWVEDYAIQAVLYAWQLGQENGNALCDVLSGKVNPSGKLTDTIAKKYEFYPSAPYFGNRKFNNYTEDIFVGYRYFDTFHPEQILYPFGFGLSYTTFEIDSTFLGRKGENETRLQVTVKNTGSCSGKEVVQVYATMPEGKLGKEKKRLAAYQKTKLLLPNESQTIEFCIRDREFSSFDDSGVTGYKDAFVLEAGKYTLLVGNSSAACKEVGSFEIASCICVEQCKEVCCPNKNKPFQVMTPKGMQPVAMGSRDLRKRILKNLPEEIPVTGDLGITLSQVKSGEHTLEEFIAQLSDKELGDLTRGWGGMGSPFGMDGNAGAFGGITEELRAKGIPAIITADGPAGLRVRRHTALLPCGTAIGCTWNDELVEQVFQKVGEETVHFGVDIILSPGMNIHRNPLCGRNFEYYSEDPYLSGKIAAAAVRGIQNGGTSACPKHFACNNQEVNRNRNDSRISMRALREIYLRNFEICVKEGRPQNLMTSYNKINGVWSHYNYDLVTTVLREEWNYPGNVITDWWMRKSKSPEFPALRDNAYRTRAQVDVLMPGNMSYAREYVEDQKQLITLGKKDGLTRGELQRSAKNVLRFAMTRGVKRSVQDTDC